MLGFVEGQPIHVVVAREPENRHCFVMTAYRPDANIWSDDFKMRRQ